MDKIWIQGGVPLKGTVVIEGAKNAALPLMTAALLTDETLTLTNIPPLGDIETMRILLGSLGAETTLCHQSKTLRLRAMNLLHDQAHYDIVRKMRASILVLGPLVARHGEALVSLPGGCAIGARPVDLHVKGLQALGAEVTLHEGYIHAKAPSGLRGGSYTFPKISVTGTENLLMAATLAKGTTQLFCAAREPEVADLAHCLNAMGAQIEGIGTDTLTIHGVPALHGTTHRVLPDRIETGTYLMAAAITGGELILQNTSLDLLPSVSATLGRMGVHLDGNTTSIYVKSPPPHELVAQDVTTDPYPGFATDLQAQLMALLTLTQGAGLVTETIFENRFMHVAELLRMGADIMIQGHSALVRGVSSLRGAPVMATDLRASVSLVLAALAAKGETTISRVYHLDRGYHGLDAKIRACGGHIERMTSDGVSVQDLKSSALP